MSLRKKLGEALESTQGLTSMQWEVADTCFRLIDRVGRLRLDAHKNTDSNDIEDILEYALRPYQILLQTFNLHCKTCNGIGTRVYASTSTWRGGIGGAAMTRDVCDSCWGTGRSDKQGINLREHSG